MTEILDLRHASARLMRPLLEAEARLWVNRLRWDYRSSVELLLDYLESRTLPGFVALDHGVVQGFAFCVYEAQKAVIGDCFAPSAFARAPGDEGRDPVLQLLLRNLATLVLASPGVERVESQLLLYPSGSLAALLAEEGFRSFPRYFMECELQTDSVFSPPPSSDTDILLRRWLPDDYQPAADLIHLAYEGHIDAEINDQYRSLHGSLRFLHNIVRFPGCGVFQPSHSWALESRRTGTLVGLLLCSRVDDNVAHITQLCVAPGFRGRRLGCDLLVNSMRTLRQAGYAAISLTVTAENTGALALYRQAGFRIRHDFDAAVFERRHGDASTGAPLLALR